MSKSIGEAAVTEIMPTEFRYLVREGKWTGGTGWDISFEWALRAYKESRHQPNKKVTKISSHPKQRVNSWTYQVTVKPLGSASLLTKKESVKPYRLAPLLLSF